MSDIMITADEPLRIPDVRAQEHTWIPADTGYHSKVELRRQTGAYESSVTPAIADWRPAIPGAVAADMDEAARALVDFDSYSGRILGDGDAALGPMAAILLRTESASSSQIENLTTSAKQLALAEIDESEKINALTVVGNVRAMEAALALSDSIDVPTILEMHRELLRHQSGSEVDAGRFRDELVWIGKDDAGPRGADFVAPQADLVAGAIDDLVLFARRDDLPALLQIAVAHAQFETIHPFVDGNGRTGRALAQAMLRNKGLVSHTTVPLSAGLLRNTTTYFEALELYRNGDAEPIAHRFADAARYAAVSGRGLVDDLAEQLRESREKLAGVRSDALAWSVLPRLIAQPVINARYLKRSLGMSDMAAQRAVDQLVDRGVLEERTGLLRNRVWQHAGILTVLDDYAKSIRRA
jgi:Fic family protein